MSSQSQSSPTGEIPILEMRGITKQFPGVMALQDVSFTCLPGEVHALVGENGAGKSTLMKILSGAYRPDAGELILKQQPVAFRHPLAAQQSGISIIYQEFNLIPYRSVAHNIFLGREPMRGRMVDERRMVQDTAALLRDLGVDISPTSLVANLRVARQQEVEIAKALSLNADILIMDEPTAALSLHEVDHLLELVLRLKQRGVTIVYISHRLEEVFRIADRITVLKDGRVVTTTQAAEVTRDDLVHLMVGRELESYFPPRARPEDIQQPILEVRDVSAGNSIKNVSLTLRRGEIIGLAGLEGSGRTFLARVLFGAERITSGAILLDGKLIQFRNPQQAIAAGVGFISDDRKAEGLVLPLSVRWNMALPSLNRRQTAGYIQRQAERKMVLELAESLDLRGSGPDQEVQYLSGGNQQKVVLAKWLATQARLLVFDEPTRGIDVGAKAGIHQLMRQLASEGVGILMVSSDLPEVLGMSDRILVMRQGSVVAEFAGAEATENLIMKAATGITENGNSSTKRTDA
ncbi:MAG: sugar ABC transporter ATP-binding protein [Anaerolineae bacterium]|nr:sugar ABC transporter ATP-binding protein [Anaerolineae bacterium]